MAQFLILILAKKKLPLQALFHEIRKKKIEIRTFRVFRTFRGSKHVSRLTEAAGVRFSRNKKTFPQPKPRERQSYESIYYGNYLRRRREATSASPTRPANIPNAEGSGIVLLANAICSLLAIPGVT